MMADDIQYTTLSDLLGEAADSEENDIILDRLKAAASESLPEGWEELKLLNMSKTELLGNEPIETLILNKIRYAIPTVAIARAFNPGATSLPEKMYRDCRMLMLNWSFCRALIVSPPVVVNKIWGSVAQATEFHNFLKPIKHLFISREKATQQLGGDTAVKKDDQQDERKRERTKDGGEKRDESPPPKRARLDDLESQMKTGFKVLYDKLEQMNQSKHRSGGRQAEYNTEKENEDSEHSSSESEYEAPSWRMSDEEELDFSLTPTVKECKPRIPEPEPEIKEQGIQCQKLGSAGWKNIRYKEVQKKLQAAPVFMALKVNRELESVTPKSLNQSILVSSDSMAGTLTHGLLQQRSKLSSALRTLVAKAPETRETVKELFFAESSRVKTISDDLLHYTCAKRAEVIALRRSQYKPVDQGLTARMTEIPPSESHLFESKSLSKFLKRRGVTMSSGEDS